jgi:hypothetical protein
MICFTFTRQLAKFDVKKSARYITSTPNVNVVAVNPEFVMPDNTWARLLRM